MIIVVDVPRFLTSTSGVSPMTSTVSCTPATLSANGRLTFSPAVTTTSRVVVPKPARVTCQRVAAAVEGQEAELTLAAEAVRVPSSPDSVTVTPGSTPPGVGHGPVDVARADLGVEGSRPD